MATIFYSMAGEGRGHAARVRAVVEALLDEHHFVLLASGEAFDFLAPLYADAPRVEVKRIPGLRFHYSAGRINLSKTAIQGIRFRAQLDSHIAALCREIDRRRPDLAITDFEPLLPRAAQRCGVPVVSLDHQHFLLTYDLASLPRRLRHWAWWMEQVVKLYGIDATATIVSAFYRPRLRPGCEEVLQVGPLLRPAVRAAEVTQGDHLLGYLRPTTPGRVIDCFVRLDREVRIYGLGERDRIGGVSFRPIDEISFLADLASCDAVVAAAGNQLIGEALSLGKPFLAVPEARHHEQQINAHFLHELGGGEWELLDRFDESILDRFLKRLRHYRHRLADVRDSLDGVPVTTRAIRQMLPATPPNRPRKIAVSTCAQSAV